MTIAQRVVEQANKCSRAFSLYAGYGYDSEGNIHRTPQGVEELIVRNKEGRVTTARFSYADGSVVEYRYRNECPTYTVVSK